LVDIDLTIQVDVPRIAPLCRQMAVVYWSCGGI